MSLRSEPTSQSLEKKLLIMGYEVPDVLAIFLLLSILNFLFGQTNHKLFLIWLPVLVVALVLRLGKREKPDNYLVHLAKCHLQSKYFSAFEPPTRDTTPPKRRKKN